LWLVVAGGSGTSRIFAELELRSIPARVFFAGYIPDALLTGLYAGALAMAYVSTYEGFGLPILEAMATGTPVLVGNCSSLPEVAGGAGLLVDPFNVDEIADGLMRLVETPGLREQLRHAGLARARR